MRKIGMEMVKALGEAFEPQTALIANMDYVAGDDDGIEGDDDEILGAIRKARRPRLSAPRQGPEWLQTYVGMGTASWSGATDTADDELTIEPQRDFRPERLIIDVTASGGETPAGLVVLRSIFIGDVQQSPSREQAAPAAMFAKDATVSKIDLQVAKGGRKFSITLGVTAAPGAGVTQTAVAGFFGAVIKAAG